MNQLRKSSNLNVNMVVALEFGVMLLGVLQQLLQMFGHVISFCTLPKKESRANHGKSRANREGNWAGAR